MSHRRSAASPTRSLPVNGSGADERSPLEVERLFARARRGDGAARTALIERFLPLAHRLARRYARSSEPVDDLVQVASMGLVKAVDRFDGDRGLSFTTYAVPTILGELKRHFRDTSWSVHLPRSLLERALAVQQTEALLADRLGRSPRVIDVAHEAGLSIEQVLEALDAARAHQALSLDAPQETADGERESLAATIGGADERYELVECGATIEENLRHLSARERRVLELRFGQELTQSQIAERIGVSQMQVSRIIRASLQRLRDLAEQEPPAARRARAQASGAPLPG
jgi:RNA polymerase sigma-B factor